MNIKIGKLSNLIGTTSLLYKSNFNQLHKKRNPEQNAVKRKGTR